MLDTPHSPSPSGSPSPEPEPGKGLRAVGGLLDTAARTGLVLACGAALAEVYFLVGNTTLSVTGLAKGFVLALFTLLLPLMLTSVAFAAVLGLAFGLPPWSQRLSALLRSPSAPGRLLALLGIACPLTLAGLLAHDHLTARFITSFRPPESAAPVLLMAEYGLLALVLLLFWLGWRLLSPAFACLDARLARRVPDSARLLTLLGLGLGGVLLLFVFLAARIVLEFDAIERLSMFAVLALGLLVLVAVPLSLIRARPRRRVFLLASYTLALAVLLSGPTLSRNSLLLAGMQNHAPLFRMVSPLYLAIADPDNDQFPSFMGGRDTAPFDPWVYPAAPEIPGNGVDDNCLLGDPPAGYVPPRDPRFVELPEGWKDKEFNILLITIDALRWDHLPFNGYHRDTAPRMSELVRESVNFSRAYAQGTGTILSIPSYMSGLYTAQMRCTNLHKEPDARRPYRDVEFLPDYLRTKGYFTALFSATQYLQFFSELDWDIYSNPRDKMARRHDVTSDEITDRALRKLRDILPRYKTFAWLHYFDPHDAYVPHPGEKSFGTRTIDLYDGEIHFTDKHIGRLIEEWRRTSPLPTVIIISADHGESLGEHGIPYHNMNFYDSIVRVPLIFHIPGTETANVDEPVALLDIAPTLRNLLGDSPHPEHFGRSLLGEIFHGERDPERYVFHSAQFRQFKRFFAKRGISGKRFKFMWDLVSGSEELYDIQQDPKELHNLLGEDPEIAARMRGLLYQKIEDVSVSAPYLNNCDYRPPVRFTRYYPPAREGMTDEFVLDELPEDMTRNTDIVFGDPPALRLLRYEINPSHVQDDRRVTVRLYFEKFREIHNNYLIFVHLRGATGGMRQVVSNYDHWPVHNLLPIPEWPMNAVVLDEFEFSVPPGTGDGRVNIFIGLWDHLRDRRMPVSAYPQGTRVQENRILLGSIHARTRSITATPVSSGERPVIPNGTSHDTQ